MNAIEDKSVTDLAREIYDGFALGMSGLRVGN